MALYCPVTGLKVITNPTWINQKVSDTFVSNFWIINGSIIYSLPQGYADPDGVQNSLALNDQVASHVSADTGPYIQIEDYHFLTGSSSAARRNFINKINNDKRIATLIFCNLSMPSFIAVKIGQRFNTTGKNIHVVRQYRDAIKQALKLCRPDELAPYKAPIDLSNCLDDIERCLSPVELLCEDTWDIKTPEYSNRAVLIDRSILHSTSEGHLESEHISLTDRMRFLCQSAISEDAKIDYIVVDTTKLKGGSPSARKKYMQSLKSWHQQFPLKMYIIYGANTFMKTALHLARPSMPFKVKIAKDLKDALHLIQKDKSRKLSKKHKIQKYEKHAAIKHSDIEKVMAFIAGINWEKKGINNNLDIKEEHPFFFLYQSIKLIKEELDALFIERERAKDQIAASLKENEVLLREIHHRVKNNMQSIISMLRIQAIKTSDKRLKQIFGECQNRINAMSLIHETLYQSEDLARIDFEGYLKKLCRSLSQAHGAPGRGIKVTVKRWNITPNMDQSIAVGMVICELVTNAFQHAFPSGKEGKVSVSLSGLEGKQVELIVSDNGKGLPPQIDIFNSPSFGLQLAVATVTRELDGSISVKRNGGTCFIMRFNCKCA